MYNSPNIQSTLRTIRNYVQNGVERQFDWIWLYQTRDYVVLRIRQIFATSPYRRTIEHQQLDTCLYEQTVLPPFFAFESTIEQKERVIRLFMTKSEREWSNSKSPTYQRSLQDKSCKDNLTQYFL